MTNIMLILSFGLLFTILQVQATPIFDENTKEFIEEYEETKRALFDIFNLGLNSLKDQCNQRIHSPGVILPNERIALTKLANGHVYYFPRSDLGAITFERASAFCLEHGMHLVTINSQLENRLVFDRAVKGGLTGLATAPGAWIGLKDINGNRMYQWIQPGVTSNARFFGTAAVAAGQCALYNNGAVTDPDISWVTIDCGALSLFICELEPPCSKVATVAEIAPALQ